MREGFLRFDASCEVIDVDVNVAELCAKNAAVSMLRENGMAAHLRVYPQELPSSTNGPTIHMRLGDLFPLLAQAQRGNYLWLNDFEDDEVIVSEDLYEILRSFRSYRPSA